MHLSFVWIGWVHKEPTGLTEHSCGGLSAMLLKRVRMGCQWTSWVHHEPIGLMGLTEQICGRLSTLLPDAVPGPFKRWA